MIASGEASPSGEFMRVGSPPPSHRREPFLEGRACRLGAGLLRNLEYRYRQHRQRETECRDDDDRRIIRNAPRTPLNTITWRAWRSCDTPAKLFRMEGDVEGPAIGCRRRDGAVGRTKDKNQKGIGGVSDVRPGFSKAIATCHDSSRGCYHLGLWPLPSARSKVRPNSPRGGAAGPASRS